jgi:signal transduction histidine kinase
VHVGARANHGKIVVTVKDHGLGIPAADLERIFEMFTQVGGEGARAGGLGIGLALVRGVVEMHGGSVHARSDGPGRGSMFVVSLPAAATPG